MATRIIMPKLGMAMSEGTVVKWLKDDGAEVKAGEPIVVIMSKKITYEVESPAAGVLRPVAKAKEVRGIGQVIGFVTEPGEATPEVEVEAPPAKAAPKAAPAAAAPAAPVPKAGEVDVVPSSPAARRLAKELGVDISRVSPSGSRISEDDVRHYHEERSRIVASPLARRMAEEEGLDLATIQGTGPGGRITEEDVLHALQKRGVPAAAPPSRIPFAGMRQAIADQMVHSLSTMAQISMNTTADVTELKSTREALGARWGGRKPSYTDLLVKAVAVALQEHPLLGARLEGDEIVMPTEYNIGVAVALEDGLIVPVIRNADELSIAGLARKVNDLADRARSKKLNPDEVHGGTFTITNFGIFGGLFGLPIINQPQVAILGTGGIQKRPVVVGDGIAIRSMMYLALSFDHRVVDGALGDQFLRSVKRSLEGFDESSL